MSKQKKNKMIMEHKTMFVIGWLSEIVGDKVTAGVCSNAFPTREQAETEMHKFMAAEKDDMSTRCDVDNDCVIADYEKGVVYDTYGNEYIKYEIHEVDMKL